MADFATVWNNCAHPHPLLFLTVSGAHLYGFPSPDSDYDFRGAHILPARDLLGLRPPRETVEMTPKTQGFEIDVVTHDIGKYFGLLLKRNGYVLEQLYSPLVVDAAPELDELKEIALGCVTRHHGRHYLGFAANDIKSLQKKSPPSLKKALYVFRVLMVGIHLMRTGRVEANLLVLNQEHNEPWVEELVSRKIALGERAELEPEILPLLEQRILKLTERLEQAMESSHLPEKSTAEPALNDLLLRLRLG